MSYCCVRTISALYNNYGYLRGMDTLSGEITLSNGFRFLFEKGSTLKGKNLLPLGANSLLSE